MHFLCFFICVEVLHYLSKFFEFEFQIMEIEPFISVHALQTDKISCRKRRGYNFQVLN